MEVSNGKQIPKFSQSVYYFQSRPNSKAKFGSKDDQRFVDLSGHDESVLVQVDQVESLNGDIPRQNLTRCDEPVLCVQCNYNVMVHKLFRRQPHLLSPKRAFLSLTLIFSLTFGAKGEGGGGGARKWIIH